MMNLPAVKPCEAQTRCKVCNGVARLYGVVDFSKNCEELRGIFLPLRGLPIYYHQCPDCRLLFTEAFDGWSKQDYLAHIYNEDYVEIDPDYLEIRPRENSRVVKRFLAGSSGARHLDYGGGNGMLSSLLSAGGLASSTWDPMDSAAIYPSGHFTLVTAFEVFEHTPQPIETLAEILKLCDPAAPLVLFSTYTVDALAPRSMDFWYLAPRNGHITVHTEPSLQALFKGVDLKVHHFGNGWHLAYRELPGWVDLGLFSGFDQHSWLYWKAFGLGKRLGIVKPQA